MLLSKYADAAPYFGLSPESVSKLIRNGFYDKLMFRVKRTTKL